MSEQERISPYICKTIHNEEGSEPPPPMPEYLEAKNLAPAIAAGMSFEETRAKWQEKNPGKCIHDWRWHATGAGMGWFCAKCDEYKPYTPEPHEL